MKILFTLLTCLVTLNSHADFIDAQENYNSANYIEAFKEYETLAKLGNIKSQYNLAVMYAKGQGTEQNLIKAYAWSKLVADVEEYSALSQMISGDLSPEEMINAKSLENKIFLKYSHDKSKILLGPIAFKKQPNSNNKFKYYTTIIMDKTIAPMYPKKMMEQLKSGWVETMFYIYPDGSIKDLQVIESFPANAFNKEAIKAIEQYKFHFENDEGKVVKATEPRAATQKIEFKISTAQSILNNKGKSYLEKLEKKADNGDLKSQYEFAAIQDKYSFAQDLDQKKMNQWLFNSAQEGNVDAQYRLGKNIYYGKACKIEKQKGLDWVMHAAQIGSPQAQYMAYRMLKNGRLNNQSEKSAFYWLEQAAKNGVSIAQLIYAKEISDNPTASHNELNLAKSYIKNYARNTYKTIQWYQISAMLDVKMQKYSKAYKNIKKAYKLAKKYGWDLTELEQQKAMIELQKNS